MGLKPLISVCIPCYNNEEFIAGTLQSLLNQSFSDFEIVVVDDKSTDRTLSVVQSFADPRIRLIQNDQNLGLAANWNRALSYSRGKYVKLLCGDDVLYPTCLARQAAILEAPANSNVVLAICNREVIDSRNKVVLRRQLPFPAGLASGNKLIRESIRRGSNLVGEPAVGLFRREVLSQTAPCDPSNPYVVDLAFWAELLKHGDAFLDKECLAAFRITAKAASAKIGRRQAAFFRKFIRTMRVDPFYKLGTCDQMLGYVLSFQWCVLRNAFMSFHFNLH